MHFNGNVAAPRRLDRGPLAAGRGVRLPVRGLRRLSHRAAARGRRGGHGAVRRAARAFPTATTCSRSTTPEFSTFSGNVFVLWGHDENFYEWASGRIIIAQRRPRLAADRPAPGQRHLSAPARCAAGPTAARSTCSTSRGSSWSTSSPGRSSCAWWGSTLQRAAGRPSRRHPHRGAAPHLRSRGGRFRPGDGIHPGLVPRRPAVLLPAESGHRRSSLGYGSTLRDPVDDAGFDRSGMRRVSDGVFVKMSYLFRM